MNAGTAAAAAAWGASTFANVLQLLGACYNARTAPRLEDHEAAGRLNARDTTRIARALEVALSTGRTLSDWQAKREGGIADQVSIKPLVLLPPRPWLYQRCDARFEAMVEAGAISEVEALLKRGLDPALPVMRAIGVREIAEYLRGGTTREEMIAKGSQATRNYAKRQYTWFAHQPPAQWPRLDRLGRRPRSGPRGPTSGMARAPRRHG